MPTTFGYLNAEKSVVVQDCPHCGRTHWVTNFPIHIYICPIEGKFYRVKMDYTEIEE